MSLDITVHHFNVDSSSPPSIRLLEAARQLVDAATVISSDWHSISVPSVASFSCTGTSIEACFVWGRAPPVIDRNLIMAHEEPELYDWDAPMEDRMEVTGLDSLLEFEETDLIDIFLHPKSRFTNRTPRSNPSSHSSLHSSGDVDVNSGTQLRNRFFSQTESRSPPPAAISISRLIPFPHYYESLDPARPPPPGINNIPAFRIVQSLTSSASLTTQFARTAWLVPLRGVPPVEGASPAQLDYTHSCEPLPQDQTLSPRTIQWTPAAVTQFWTFMLRQRSTNNFGPIALAYMFSPPLIHKHQRKERNERQNRKLKEGDIYGDGEGNRTKKRRKISILEEGYDEPAEVSVWEYIKIYHDSQYAMKLRSLLDSFRLEEDADGDKGKFIGDATLPTQYRVLKATQLVLVDEIGEAILLA